MDDVELPNRLVAFGEEPLGKRFFGGLLDFPNKPAFSASFGLFLLSRQLEVANPHEIWVVFASTPVQFSLREIKIVTGLPCGKYPKVQKKKKRRTGGKLMPYYSTLFGLEEDVTVERVIKMLMKRVGFLSYPWGRLSFEMMMTSIKEMEVEQLATTCVAVQGLLYALQLVVLEAVPAIQEGPQIDEVVGSDLEEEAAAGVGSRQELPSSSGMPKMLMPNARNTTYVITIRSQQLILFLQAHLDPIIFPDSWMNPAEDLTWSNDKDDVRVENIVKMAEEGKPFSNEMFGGGCIPTEVVVASKKQKRGGKTKVVRGRKAPTNARSATGLRRKNRSPIEEEGEGSGGIDIPALSCMIDDKLKAQCEKIIKGVIHWFTENLSVDAGNRKGSVSGEHGTQAEQTAADADGNTNDLSSPDPPNKNAEADVNPIPPPCHPLPMETDFTLPAFQGDQAISAVDDVVSFYNSVDVPVRHSCGGTNFNEENKIQGDVGDGVMGVDHTTVLNDQDLNRSPASGEEGQGISGPLSSPPPKSEITEMDPIPNVSPAVPPVGPPIPTAAAEDFPIYSSQPKTSVHEEIVITRTVNSNTPPSQSIPSKFFFPFFIIFNIIIRLRMMLLVVLLCYRPHSATTETSGRAGSTLPRVRRIDSSGLELVYPITMLSWTLAVVLSSCPPSEPARRISLSCISLNISPCCVFLQSANSKSLMLSSSKTCSFPLAVALGWAWIRFNGSTLPTPVSPVFYRIFIPPCLPKGAPTPFLFCPVTPAGP
ncbi:unnamed protein product [Arabidopsis thaliana]|uniref:(thale cress) hypothetical protein n=1 Tax=Arabidopsis thaliana TaxID=3702 RepID=A0A7G2DYY9_ARATH|nr:unnamed protein product [Arabidopsis thaliana]